MSIKKELCIVAAATVMLATFVTVQHDDSLQDAVEDFLMLPVVSTFECRTDLGTEVKVFSNLDTERSTVSILRGERVMELNLHFGELGFAHTGSGEIYQDLLSFEHPLYESRIDVVKGFTNGSVDATVRFITGDKMREETCVQSTIDGNLANVFPYYDMGYNR